MKQKTHSLSGICRQCGKRKYISVRGFCLECGLSNRLLAANQMRSRKGPIYDSWQKSMLRNAVKIANDLKLSRGFKEKLAREQRQIQEQQHTSSNPGQETQQHTESDLPELPHYPEEDGKH